LLTEELIVGKRIVDDPPTVDAVEPE